MSNVINEEMQNDEFEKRYDNVEIFMVAKLNGRILATRKVENPNNIDEVYNEVDDEVQDQLAEDVQADFFAGVLPEFDTVDR